MTDEFTLNCFKEVISLNNNKKKVEKHYHTDGAKFNIKLKIILLKLIILHSHLKIIYLQKSQ